jgi:hypothetical protein
MAPILPSCAPRGRDRINGTLHLNALSNFVADASSVVGFDPFERLIDFILDRAASTVAVG